MPMISTPIGIWDLDGSLIDSVHNRESGCPKIFADILREEFDLSEDQYRAVLDYYAGPGCGLPVKIQYSDCLHLLGLPENKLEDLPENKLEELAQRYFERAYSQVFPLYPDVVPCFEALTGLGYDQHCISTSMKSEFRFRDGREIDHVTETVRANGFDKYLRFWFGGKRADEGKSHQKELIKHGFGVSDADFREMSYMVGDSENDMMIASDWNVALPIYVNRRGFSMQRIKRELEERRIDSLRIFIVPSLEPVPIVVHNRFRI